MPKKIQIKSFDAIDKSIREILKTNYEFRIPRYQRSYSWVEDNIYEFWQDLISSTEPYFFGSFIFCNKESGENERYIEVIDGQQRLLTITIFAAVLRDLAKELGNKDLANRIQRVCIAFVEDVTGKESYKIMCGESTQKFFKENIQDKNSKILDLEKPPKDKEYKLIYAAYKYLKERVLEEIKKKDRTKDQNLKYIEKLYFLLLELKIIYINIYNDEQAYEIFETVNAKGEELNQADLLKNLIFKKVRERKHGEKIVDTAKVKWAELEENVKSTKVDLSKFIRQFWLSKYSFVIEKKLYKTIKKKFSDEEYGDFLNNLLIASKHYNLLISGLDADWEDIQNGNKILNALKGIRLIRIKQCYVLFLSIMRNLKKIKSEKNILYVFDLIEKFSYIYSAICKLPTNKIYKLYSSYAIKLEKIFKESKEKHVEKNIERLFQQLKEDLKEFIPPIGFFKEKFNEIEYKNNTDIRKLISYTLAKINKNFYQKTKEYKIDFDNVNLEHILPQTPNKNWKVKPEEIKEFVNKIGNLIILDKRINSRVGNKDIKEKLKILKESEITMNKELIKEIVEKKKWFKSGIIKRTEELSSLAYNKVWKI